MDLAGFDGWWVAGGWLEAGGLKMPEVSFGGFPKGNAYRWKFGEVEGVS